ncbi:unnamed protein product [Camellia sinensis]
MQGGEVSKSITNPRRFFTNHPYPSLNLTPYLNLSFSDSQVNTGEWT